jgi:hypothetical protein
MTDTPKHIKDIQLQIWLSKPPAERLRQFLIDNDALYTFWQEAKLAREKNLREKTSSTNG